MVARLILFLLLYGVAAIVGGATVLYVGKRLLRGPIERYRHRLQGRRNAKLLDAKLEEVCFVCLERVNPVVDAFDTRRGWYHADCYKQLLNG